MIKATDITKSYGSKLILDDLTMQFPKGKITSLIGSNGAGKSTLLSIISRLLEQDAGTVNVDGKRITEFKNKEIAQRLSILKQSHNIGMKLSVEELVSFGRFPYSQGRLKEEDQRKIDEALRFLSLDEIKDSYLDELSGGQKQRAYLAMVVAQDTDYILLGEPLNNLDMKYSIEIMTTLRKLADELDKTIIIVLHDINFASHYSDYIAALKDGDVKYYGITNKVITEQILHDVFDIRCAITKNNGKKTCNYFNHNYK